MIPNILRPTNSTLSCKNITAAYLTRDLFGRFEVQYLSHLQKDEELEGYKSPKIHGSFIGNNKRMIGSKLHCPDPSIPPSLVISAAAAPGAADRTKYRTQWILV
jgi:hypothetical protein